MDVKSWSFKETSIGKFPGRWGGAKQRMCRHGWHCSYRGRGCKFDHGRPPKQSPRAVIIEPARVRAAGRRRRRPHACAAPPAHFSALMLALAAGIGTHRRGC